MAPDPMIRDLGKSIESEIRSALRLIRVSPCFSVACLIPCESVFFRGLFLSVLVRVFPWLVLSV